MPAAGVVVDGGTPFRAFASIGAAALALDRPGEVVCVGPGTYPEQDISPSLSGIAAAPIVFRADPTGVSTQDPAGPVRLVPPEESGTTSAAGFRLFGRRHVVIAGFVIEGYTDPAIQVRSAAGAAGNSSDIAILDNLVRNTVRTGIDVFAEGVITIEGNHVSGSVNGSGISLQSCMGAAPVGENGAGVEPRCSGGPGAALQPSVQWNRLEDNRSHGVFIQDAVDGVVEHNEFYDNQGSGISLRHVRRFVVADNIVHRSGGPGVTVRSAVGIPGNSSEVTVRKNRLRGPSNGTGVDISAEGAVTVVENHVLGFAGSGIAVQACIDAAEPDDANADANPRCRGGAGDPVEVLVDTNRLGINAGHGVFVRDALGGSVQNNVIFSNDMTGITLRNSPDFTVFNNLIYRNRDQGLAVGTADQPSPRVVVVNNTFFGNERWGIDIGSAGVASEEAMIVNNILMLNGEGNQGIGVRNETALLTRSTCGYIAGFNVMPDRYGPNTPRNVYDIDADPLFANPVTGPDGVLGGRRDAGGALIDNSVDDDFTLRQTGAARVSPAIDAGYATVATVGISGSTSSDGSPDTGILDAGYHYGVAPGATPNLPVPFMPLFVRRGGSNSNSGKSLDQPLATVAAGALRARAGVTIVVGPGTYAECNLGPPRDQGRATFLADPSGFYTGDPPDSVVVDAGCCHVDLDDPICQGGATGFVVSNSCGVVVDGFHVRGAAEHGILIRAGSRGAAVRHNVAFSNLGYGLGVIDSDDVRVFNNLVYANKSGGIEIGGGDCEPLDCEHRGSRRALLENNTFYGNGGSGILIGSGPGASSHATVRYNILHVGRPGSALLGANGLQLGDGVSIDQHLEGYTAYLNVNYEGRYGGVTPRPSSDRTEAPQFVDPAGRDGVLGGIGFADDSFHLSHRAAGQGGDSVAIDLGDVPAVVLGLDTRTTRTDQVRDLGPVDAGYHYPLFTQRAIGDCNGDGLVTVSELIRAVRIALGEFPIDRCPNADANGDGIVSISELTLAVRNALFGAL